MNECVFVVVGIGVLECFFVMLCVVGFVLVICVLLDYYVFVDNLFVDDVVDVILIIEKDVVKLGVFWCDV